MKKMRTSTKRGLVAGAFLVLAAVGYFAHVGVGNLSAFGWDAFSFLCPLGYLESLLAGKVFVPRALISFAAVVLLVIVLGRAFCAWACPMPLLQRLLPGRKKRFTEGDVAQKRPSAETPHAEGAEASSVPAAPARGKPRSFALDSRFGVLLGALASAAVFGFPVFCLICPVGLTFATVFLVMRLFAVGDVTWTVVAVPVVLVLEVVFLRKWCSKICPLGALLSLISAGNKTLRPAIDDKKCLVSSRGAHCFACSRACPERIDIRRPASSERTPSNCTKCRECADACPAHAITFPFLPKGGVQQANSSLSDGAAREATDAEEQTVRES